MSDPVHYKTSCGQCNGRFEFPAAAAGATINCPHCGASTVLTPPPGAAAPSAAPVAETRKCQCQHCNGTLAYPPAAEGATVNCPHCAKPTKLAVGGAAVQEGIEAALGEIAAAEKKKPRKRYVPGMGGDEGSGKGKLIAIISTVVVLLAGAGGFLFLKKGGKEEGPKKPEKDLEVLEYHLQKAKDGGLVYVIGTVTNHSGQQYFRLNIEFELSDAENKPLGSTTDYVGSLGANKTWDFKAIVLESATANAKLLKLEGEPESAPAAGGEATPAPAEPAVK